MVQREPRCDSGTPAQAISDLLGRHGASPETLWSWIDRLQEAQGDERRGATTCLGAVQTPHSVAQLMARRLLRFPRRQRSLHVLDAGCGSGRLLTASVREAASRGLDVHCEGVEADAAAAGWAGHLEPMLQAASVGHLRSWNVVHADFLLGHEPRVLFDAFIANPPYVPARSLQSVYRQRLRRRYPTAARSDLSALFLERMLQLLRPGGRFCVIVPNKLLAADYAASLRRRLFEETEVEEIWDLAGSSVFPGHAAYPVVLVACRRRPRAQHRVCLLRADGSLRARWSQRALLELPQHVVPLELPEAAQPLLRSLLRGRRLGDVVSLGCGIATSGFHRAVGRGNDRILCSGDIAPFRIRKRQRFAADEVALTRRSRLRQQVPKVVIPGMFRRMHAAFDSEGDLLGRVYFVPVEPEDRSRRFLLLAMLNSRLYDVLYRGLFGAVAQSGGYLRLNAPYLRRLPWPEGPIPPELARAVQSLEAGSRRKVAQEKLDRAVEDLFALSPRQRQILRRLESWLRQESESRPRTARKLPGLEAPETAIPTVRAM